MSVAAQDQEPKIRETLLKRFTNLCVRYVERFMPDPYLFAVILTLVVVVGIFAFVPGATAGGIVESWYGGVWGNKNIFTFAMQMVLILVSGYTLAEAPVVKRGIGWLASKPRNQVEGALLCFFVVAASCLLNWGLGLVAGALVARQVGKRLRGVNFGFLVAAGYMGYMVWTNGLSSSIALANTDKSSPLNVIYQQTGQLVPLSNTVFQPYIFVPTLVVIVVLALAIWRMSPSHTFEVDDAVFDFNTPEEVASPQPRTFADRLENLWILNVGIFLAGAAFFVRSGFALNIGSMVMLFTVTAALLHGTPIRFIKAFNEAAKTAGPLILQYPLYGGIVGLLGYLPTQDGRALQTVLASAVVAGANSYTLPFLSFVLSVIISLFVPSGGGHWAVQGPIMVDAATSMGQGSQMYLGMISMTVAFGEGVANMIQPFWLMPVLAIAKLNVRQVMGFTVVAFVLGLLVFGTAALIAPWII